MSIIDQFQTSTGRWLQVALFADDGLVAVTHSNTQPEKGDGYDLLLTVDDTRLLAEVLLRATQVEPDEDDLPEDWDELHTLMRRIDISPAELTAKLRAEGEADLVPDNVWAL